ncbi:MULTISPECIES: flagellin [unclassified Shinella]|uniref:flagellin N-terminal helical domain-containing protein n=1 Tax=unclassified Shinella TaxID=2643062 RepID=UPI00225CEB7F|nr:MULTISPECIES: flagellin [unclassified Shinella]MCO5136884.1 flagellin [Shinella sp.]MDC7253439.1 flagellin [Shinella sp. YE25]CAI0340927.1 Flagellin D [Rhizobiaceae bacterium]CAK7259273.1 Flagellin D [Shinella sp. WSC3-e]
MTSILTNAAAMSALQTLRSINNGMEDTQARVSSGLRVGNASDNAAYWSIATTMRSDNMALSAVQDALGLGAAKVDTAYSGMDSAIEVVKEIKAKLVTATEDGVDKAKVQEEIKQLQDQLRGIGDAASFSGENWLKADITTAQVKNVVGSFVRDDSGNVSVKKIDYTLDTNTVLFDTGGDTGILDQTRDISGPSVTLNINVGGVTTAETVKAFTTDDIITSGAGASAFDGNYANDGAASYVKVADNTWVLAVDQSTVPDQEVAYTDSSSALWAVDIAGGAAALAATAVQQSVDNLDITTITTDAQLSNLIQMVDDALTTMTSAAASLGSISSRIDLQSEFVSKLTESIDKGVGRLVDADMNEESTRLKALQTQQQLAIQSLSIANSASQNVLSLFR